MLTKVILEVAAITVMIAGCANLSKDYGNNTATEQTTVAQASSEATTAAQAVEATTVAQQAAEQTEVTTESAVIEEETAFPEAETKNYVVVIDPGHQSKGNSAKEPVGPGASQTKAKVAGGTHGVATGIYEYEFTLKVGMKVKALLEQQGYTVIMTRESNDADISNAERAQVANNANADAFVRIHANGSENSSVKGTMTICQTASNPYNGNVYTQSRKLSDILLDTVCAYTGSNKQYVWETDTMTGINWASVPSTIVEVGYMSNREEDLLMSTDDYQNKVAAGIAEGIRKYLEG
jgi:N-acetylmuramoyl-L-alanine amidase